MVAYKAKGLQEPSRYYVSRLMVDYKVKGPRNPVGIMSPD
jgi:hypothetical protein